MFEKYNNSVLFRGVLHSQIYVILFSACEILLVHAVFYVFQSIFNRNLTYACNFDIVSLIK